MPDTKQPNKSREGRCYELAFKYMQWHNKYTLIHASVFSYVFGCRMAHALVELDDDIIYEPVADVYFNKQKLYARFKVREFKRYTMHEAIELAIATGHYGPWDKQSCKMK